MFKNAAIYLGGRITAALSGLLVVVFYSRLLTPETYGIYILIATTAFALYEGLFQWLRSSIVRFLPGETEKRSQCLGSAVIGYFIVCILVILIIAILIAFNPVGWPPHLIALGGALLISYGGLEVLAAVFQSREKPFTYTLMLISRGLGNLTLGVLLAWSGFGAQGVLTALILANATPLLVALSWNWHELRALGFSQSNFRRMLRFGLPIAFGGFAVISISAADRYLIAILMEVEDAGQYAVPVDLARRSLQMLMLSIFLAWSPSIFAAFEHGRIDDGRQRVIEQVRVTMLIVFPVALFLALGAPLFSIILVGREFRAAFTELMPWIVAGTLFHGCQNFYISYMFTITQRTLTNAFIILGGSLLNVLLNLLMIPKFGLIGAAASTVTVEVTVVCLSLLIARKWLSLPWPTMDFAKVIYACFLVSPVVWYAGNMTNVFFGLALMVVAFAALIMFLILLDAADIRTVARKYLAKRAMRQT